jgi:4-amino-4-deoxy-L-arabinose transferase-like glycosyltransferase
MTATRQPRRRLPSFGVSIAIVALAAFAVRLLYVLVIARAPVGVGGDAGFYHSAANLIADGHFYYRGIFGHSFKTAEHPPLYPLALSVVSVFGGKTLLAHRIVSCAIGSGGVVLIGLLGRRIRDEPTGLIAAGIAAVYPPLITADGLVMSEPLFVVTVALSLLVACRAVTKPTPALSIALGAVIGLATLARGEALILVPLLAWPAAYSQTRRGRATRLIATTAATLVVVAPWVVRNAVVFHRLVLAADANTLVAGANCHDTYYGHDIGWWSLDCLARGRTLDQLEAGDASTPAAFEYASDHVTRLPLVAVVRVLRTFDLFQPLRQGNREPRRKWVDVVGLVFYFPLLILAGIGLLRLRAQRWLLLAPVWMVVVVSALGWGIGRFRIAADISILVLAATVLAAGRGSTTALAV